MLDEPYKTDTSYWRLVRKKEKLSGLGNLAIMFHNSADFLDITGFLGHLPLSEKVLYMTLTKTYDVIRPYFSQIDSEIFVIDMVSDQLFEKKPTRDCIFSKSPAGLAGLVGVIREACFSIRPNYIIVDSISVFDFSGRQPRLDFLPALSELKAISRSFHADIIILFDNLVTRGKIPSVSGFDTVLKAEKESEFISWN